jgi:hypothetical protein
MKQILFSIHLVEDRMGQLVYTTEGVPEIPLRVIPSPNVP